MPEELKLSKQRIFIDIAEKVMAKQANTALTNLVTHRLKPGLAALKQEIRDKKIGKK